jgi:peptide chain release factor 1
VCFFGKGAIELFEGEAGGHRWQRVPPTEKRGRMQTSTVTVAVLPEFVEEQILILPEDIQETFTCGSGPGGQHRNKTATAVQMTHLPTGITVRAESSKSQKANREAALALIRARLLSAEKSRLHTERSDLKREQVGSGMRADKIRTVQVQNDLVIDHRTGKRLRYREYIKGKLPG